MEQDDGPSTNSDTEFAPRDEDGDEDEDGDLLGEGGDGQGQQGDAGRGAVGGRRRNDGAEWTDTMPQGPLPEFTATPGVTVNLDDDEWFKPLGIFKLFVTDAMMDQACRQTNLYWSQIEAERGDGNSRSWALLTTDELWSWLGIVVTNSCHPYPSIEDYWGSDPVFANSFVSEVMSLKRFQQIKRFIHLNDRSKEKPPGTEGYDPVFKVRPWLDGLFANCRNVYVPHRTVAVDEMDIPLKGRSRFKSLITYKRAGDGFLSYALCDSQNGYVYSSFMQFDSTVKLTGPGRLSKTFEAVRHLARQLPAKAYHIFADNLYSQVGLAQKLRDEGFLFTCTARVNRVPAIVKQPVLRGAMATAAKGTIKWAAQGDVVALTYYDNKPVPMITTAHRTLEEVIVQRTHPGLAPDGTYRMVTVDVPKLNVINDYNHGMDGVDLADQLRTNYTCRLKSRKWWHALLWWIVDTAACNAFVVHQFKARELGVPPLSHRAFQSKLAKEMIAAGTKRKTTSRRSGAQRSTAKQAVKKRPASRRTGSHFIVRCTSKKGQAQRVCVNCRDKGTGKNPRSVYQCHACDVGLHPECFRDWHVNDQ